MHHEVPQLHEQGWERRALSCDSSTISSMSRLPSQQRGSSSGHDTLSDDQRHRIQYSTRWLRAVERKQVRKPHSEPIGGDAHYDRSAQWKYICRIKNLLARPEAKGAS